MEVNQVGMESVYKYIIHIYPLKGAVCVLMLSETWQCFQTYNHDLLLKGRIVSVSSVDIDSVFEVFCKYICLPIVQPCIVRIRCV